MFNTFFKKIIWLLTLTFLLSYLGYLVPAVNEICFWLILILFGYLTVKDLSCGVLMILAELLIGSKGYLFSSQVFDFPISLRLGFFIILFLIALYRLFQKREWPFLDSKVAKWYGLFLLIMGWGIVNALWHRHLLKDIFLDFNGYLFWGLLPVLWGQISWHKIKDKIIELTLATQLVLAAKVTLLLYIFSHNIEWMILPLYRWLKDFGLGEITNIGGTNFSRVFYQSEIYSLVIFIVCSWLWLMFRSNKWQINEKQQSQILAGLGVTLYLLLITFSRSFWVGMLLAAVLLIFFNKEKIKVIIDGYRNLIWQWLKIFVLSFAVIFLVINLPPQSSFSMFGDLLKDRLMEKEEALVSRWQLWGPLVSEVLKNPILGSGWAQKITYQSADPRTRGDYTTYSFEWGYLDIALKVGFFGLLIYLVFLVKLLYTKQKTVFETGLILGAIAIAITSFFSPYLNHPLGIGYLIIVGCYLNSKM